MSVTDEADAAGGPDGAADDVEIVIAFPPCALEMPLRTPVEWEDLRYDRLFLREPTDAEFVAMLAEPVGRQRRVAISTICAIPTGVVARMAVGDTVRAFSYLVSFYDIGEVIGFGEASPAEGDTWPASAWDMPLRTPVQHAGVTYDRLSLREPTDAEFEQIMAQPDGKKRRFAISYITGVPTEVVDVIGIGDTVRAEAYLLSFFGIGQGSGVA